MAGNSSKSRQAKLAKRKAKSKQKQKQGRMQGSSSELNSIINASVNNPIEFCGYNGELSEGMVSITIARTAGVDHVLLASFNVDLYCLGVKNAFINEVRNDEFESYRMALTELSPESAKKMIEGSVEYAKGYGLKPHKDFKRSYRIFKSIDSSLSDEEYVFGKDGKPFFIQGPNDTPARVQEIMRTLENKCGVGNDDFYVMLAPDGLDDFMS